MRSIDAFNKFPEFVTITEHVCSQLFNIVLINNCLKGYYTPNQN